MKKIIYIILVTISFSSFAQTDTSSVQTREISTIAKNEFKIDAFDLAFLSTLDISYERVHNSSMGYGVSLLLNFNKEDTFNDKFAITPFFRMYFFNKQDYGAKGFFAEVYSKFTSGENREYFLSDEEQTKDYFDISLGMGLGWKWVNKNGFILEISLGGGRYLGLDKNSPELSARGGVSFGYRF